MSRTVSFRNTIEKGSIVGLGLYSVVGPVSRTDCGQIPGSALIELRPLLENARDELDMDLEGEEFSSSELPVDVQEVLPDADDLFQYAQSTVWKIFQSSGICGPLFD